MSEREFYVGYLKLPAGMKRFLLVLVPALLIGATTVCVVMATKQSDPGDGTWALDQVDAVEGVVVDIGYPVLIDDHGPVLLCYEGKHGFDQIGAGTVRGHWIARGDHRMLEVVEAELRHDGPQPRLAITALGTYHGAGQIIDPKCYLGVMKPGEGKVHKACATLCIKGGIPPMWRDNATDELYLLTDVSGAAILDPIIPYIADPITVTGELEQLAGLKILRLDVGSIQRIDR